MNVTFVCLWIQLNSVCCNIAIKETYCQSHSASHHFVCWERELNHLFLIGHFVTAQKSVKNKVLSRTSTFLPFVSIFFKCQDHWRSFLLFYLGIADCEIFLVDSKDGLLFQLIAVTKFLPVEAWCNLEADRYSVHLEVVIYSVLLPTQKVVALRPFCHS
jgi:hypothetical protein